MCPLWKCDGFPSVEREGAIPAMPVMEEVIKRINS